MSVAPAPLAFEPHRQKGPQAHLEAARARSTCISFFDTRPRNGPDRDDPTAALLASTEPSATTAARLIETSAAQGAHLPARGVGNVGGTPRTGTPASSRHELDTNAQSLRTNGSGPEGEAAYTTAGPTDRIHSSNRKD